MRQLQVKRVYAPAEDGDGLRVLVDRLWPRGIARKKAAIAIWMKEIAPSDVLRREFHGNPDGWDAFCAAYAAELQAPTAQAAARVLMSYLSEGPVTLLYAARDEQHNNAAALRDWLLQFGATGTSP